MRGVRGHVLQSCWRPHGPTALLQLHGPWRTLTGCPPPLKLLLGGRAAPSPAPRAAGPMRGTPVPRTAFEPLRALCNIWCPQPR